MTTLAPEPGLRAGATMPPATPWFWAALVLVAGMSETANDWLTRRLDTILVGAGALVVLIVLLGAQLVVTRYRPWLYWAVIAMVALVSSLAVDVLHVRSGVGDPTATVAFIAVTAVVLGVWHLADATIAPSSVVTLHQQLFWWGALGSIFALGTAAADLTAADLGLGYGPSALVFAAVAVAVAVLHRWWRVGPVVAFWLACTFVRPLGSSFGHWLSSRKALGLGVEVATCGLLVATVVVVWLGVVVTRRTLARAAR